MDKSINNFENSLKLGKTGEVIIAEWLVSKGFNVEDVSDDEYYQKIDVDFILYDLNNNPHKIEIKTDEVQHKTHNIFIEQGMDRDSGWKKGWFYYCKAELLFYHDIKNGVGQILNWKKVQSEIKQYGTSKKFWNWRDRCDGWGYLISIDKARELGWILLEYDLNNKGD